MNNKNDPVIDWSEPALNVDVPIEERAARPSPSSELSQALAKCKSSFLIAGFFSAFINLLMLVPAVYMLQVYDRVLPSSSEATLIMLTLITVLLFVALGSLEWVRSQILVVASTRIDQALSSRVFDAMFGQTLLSGGKTATAQPLNDLLQLRQFLAGPGLFAFFDAPWLPMYLALMFVFHPYFGVVGVLSALVLIGLAVWNEMAIRGDLDAANNAAVGGSTLIQQNLRNVEVIEAMGMLQRVRSRWEEKQAHSLALQSKASEKSGLITALSRTYRITVQSLMLGLGAYLSIQSEITAGVVIAGTILLGRALAPLDQIIGTWRGFLTAREAYGRLNQLLVDVPAPEPALPLPTPVGEISLDKLVITPPGAHAPVIKGISLHIPAGTLVGIVGPSAAGKSTLARAILGLYRPVKGTVRLDNAEIGQWDREELGQHIGYLPQDVELLDGSISENIARFGVMDANKVIEAAKAAAIHEMILHLPQGYQTKIVSGGKILSAGQQQRLGLARALYGTPSVIILDEPNSNLDQEGEEALVTALHNLKKKGRTVIVITHRGNVLTQVDQILMLADGQIALYGARDQVLATLSQRYGKPTTSASVSQHPAAQARAAAEQGK